ncbi:MAG: hypothetical protein K9M56_09595 [Victivallales bacterium]|nr:hypothetical protein [Victivallales bacterium]
MKKITVLPSIVLALLFLAGCATNYPVGIVYTNVKLPVTATQNKGKPTKVGTSESQSFVAVVATGNSSIDKATRDGDISEIQYVDWHAKNVLGFIGTYKTIVKGK